MKKNFLLFAPIVLLLLAYVNVNARTAHRLLGYFDAHSVGQPVFFAETQTQTNPAQTQTQTQTETQSQTQTQTQTQSQSQTQSQPLFIGFPMEASWRYKTGSPLVAQPQTDKSTVFIANKSGFVHRVNQVDGTG